MMREDHDNTSGVLSQPGTTQMRSVKLRREVWPGSLVIEHLTCDREDTSSSLILCTAENDVNSASHSYMRLFHLPVLFDSSGRAMMFLGLATH